MKFNKKTGELTWDQGTGKLKVMVCAPGNVALLKVPMLGAAIIDRGIRYIYAGWVRAGKGRIYVAVPDPDTHK